MSSLATILTGIGLAQMLLATVYFASYAFALGELAGPRGRAGAIVAGLVAAAALLGFSEAWEAAILMLVFAPLATGVFAGATWILCKLTLGTSQRAAPAFQAQRRELAPSPWPADSGRSGAHARSVRGALAAAATVWQRRGR